MKVGPVLLNLLQLLPSLWAGAPEGHDSVLGEDMRLVDRYPILSPFDVYELFPRAIERFELEAKYLFSENVNHGIEFSDALWAAMEDYHHVLFFVLVYEKAGLYGCDPLLHKTWSDFGKRLSDLDGSFSFNDPQRFLARLAIGNNIKGPFYVNCRARHAIGSSETARLLEIMSFLVRKLIQVWLRIRKIGTIAADCPRGKLLPPAKADLVSAELGAIESLVQACRDSHPEYQRERHQAALDFNTQAILTAVLSNLRGIFLDFDPYDFPRLCQLGEPSPNLASRAPNLKDLLDKALGKDSPRLSLDIPVGERLQAVWNSPYRAQLIEIGTLVGWKEHAQSCDEGTGLAAVTDPGAEFLNWLAERECRVRNIRFKSFELIDPQVDRSVLFDKLIVVLDPSSSWEGILSVLQTLTLRLKALGTILDLAQDYLSQAQWRYFSEHCFGPSDWAADALSGYGKDLYMVNFRLGEAKQFLTDLSEASLNLDKEQRGEFLSSLGSLTAEFERAGRVHDQIVATLEQLPQWVPFIRKPRIYPLMLAEYPLAKSAEHSSKNY